jgi:hypothetical protein
VAEPLVVEVNVVPHKDDHQPAVLLQLPYGYVVLRPVDARRVAKMLTETASEAEALQN